MYGSSWLVNISSKFLALFPIYTLKIANPIVSGIEVIIKIVNFILNKGSPIV